MLERKQITASSLPAFAQQREQQQRQRPEQRGLQQEQRRQQRGRQEQQQELPQQVRGQEQRLLLFYRMRPVPQQPSERR